MAVTNAEIIAGYKLDNGIDLDTPLFTFAAWKAQGRMVKKGEVCRHKVTMWKHSTNKRTNKKGEEVENSYCFHKTMYLFEFEQTEEIAK